MSEIIEFLKEFNLQNILSMIIIVWYFSRDIKESIDRLDRDLHDMNKRVSRLEGTVYKNDLYKEI
jgi:hypothetical protein